MQEFCRHPHFARIHQVEAVRVRAVAEILARHVEQLSLGALDLDRDRVRPETRLDPLVQVLVERGVDMLLGVRALCRVGAREDELERVAGREVVREGEGEGGRQGRDRDGAGLALEQRRFRASLKGSGQLGEADPCCDSRYCRAAVTKSALARSGGARAGETAGTPG